MKSRFKGRAAQRSGAASPGNFILNFCRKYLPSKFLESEQSEIAFHYEAENDIESKGYSSISINVCILSKYTNIKRRKPKKPKPNFQDFYTQRNLLLIKLVSIGELRPERLIAHLKCGKSNCHCQRPDHLSHQS